MDISRANSLGFSIQFCFSLALSILTFTETNFDTSLNSGIFAMAIINLIITAFSFGIIVPMYNIKVSIAVTVLLWASAFTLTTLTLFQLDKSSFEGNDTLTIIFAIALYGSILGTMITSGIRWSKGKFSQRKNKKSKL